MEGFMHKIQKLADLTSHIGKIIENLEEKLLVKNDNIIHFTKFKGSKDRGGSILTINGKGSVKKIAYTYGTQGKDLVIKIDGKVKMDIKKETVDFVYLANGGYSQLLELDQVIAFDNSVELITKSDDRTIKGYIAYTLDDKEK